MEQNMRSFQILPASMLKPARIPSLGMAGQGEVITNKNTRFKEQTC
jgi:hypothetical protein